MTVIEKQLVSDSVIDELEAVFVEGEFAYRWALIETYHRAGKIISEIKADRVQVLQDIAQRIGRSVRTLRYAVNFYEKYPDLNALPEGKNVSWNKIITKYLTTPEQAQCEHPENEVEIISFKVCRKCGKHLGKADI